MTPDRIKKNIYCKSGYSIEIPEAKITNKKNERFESRLIILLNIGNPMTAINNHGISENIESIKK